MMNKQCYGWVYSAVRGMWVVVGEHVKRPRGLHGGSAVTTTSANTASITSLWLVAVFVSSSAHAQIIPNRAAPTSQQPIVINAANGVPIVNIQTPGSRGLSHNRYSQLDVNPQGLILNNAQNSAQTQLAGWVVGNAMVAGRPAKIILNEVNATNPSQLLGTIEVAGNRAQVIVANASGITCNGCGFINAARATLTTGEPRINSLGSLEGYRVTGGQIAIEGLGMDTSKVPYADIIARAAQINAGLWAQYLRVTLGTNEVNAQNTLATPIVATTAEVHPTAANASTPKPERPSFALDVAALGGMYANKIYLIGTEAGLGVRNAGVISANDLAGVGEIIVLANGRLENRSRIYGDHIALQATSLVNANPNPDQAAPVIAARERLDIGAQHISNKEHALLLSLGDMAIGGELDSDHHAAGHASLIENASATIEAQGNIRIAAAEMRNSNEHFSTEIVEASRQDIVEYQGAGAPERYLAGTPEVYVYKQEIYKLHTPVKNYETWSRYKYQRTTEESRISETDPATIIAGGDIQLTGESLVNDKSQIIAGGKLNAQVTNLVNHDAEGVRTVEERGTVTSHWRDHQSGRDDTGSRTVAYAPAKSRFGIALNTVAYEDSARDRYDQLSNASKGNNALFRPAPNPNSTTVIETDPAFTNHRQWLSSAYLLAQLAVDPTTVQKRLGDGFYEQRLVREQVAQLTGRRFLEGYANDEEQYQALLNNAVSVASTLQLRPGVALSAEQVAALTSDIVWLVEKDITLTNGEHARALVPQLYARLREGDINSNGALLSGREVNLTTAENLTNSGQITAEKNLALSGNNVRNMGGQISARTVAVSATNDIDNMGGQVQTQDALVLHAGRDINVVSTTSTDANAMSRRTNVNRVASLSVTGAEGSTSTENNPTGGAGVLVAVAGRDMNLNAAAIVNSAKPSSASSAYSAESPTSSNTTTLIAGNDIHLGVVTQDSANHIVWDKKNQRRDSQRTDVGTQIHTQGDIHIAAGHDANVKAATVHSDQGAVSIQAVRNVVVAAVYATSWWLQAKASAMWMKFMNTPSTAWSPPPHVASAMYYTRAPLKPLLSQAISSICMLAMMHG